MNPYPSLVVVQRWFDLLEAIVVLDFLEGKGSKRMRMIAVRNYNFLDIQVSALVFACTAILLLLHEFSDVLEIKLSELIPIHRHIHIKLLNL